jgi:hypothetical protein
MIPAATLLISLLVMPNAASAAVCTVPGTHGSISAAVGDPSCTTINVAIGLYNEDVTIGHALTLNGAQAGQPVGTRVFMVGESTINGLVTVNAPNVTIDGFSLTNSIADAVNDNNGVLIKTAGDAALITNNLISFVGTTSLTSNAQGVYLENGPDNVSIVDNDISKIASIPSAKGIYIGDSTATFASTNTLISGNTISEIESASRGAYGIQVNNRAGQPDLTIVNNTIRDLTGAGWVHAIGLEGDTPNVVVRLNSITNMFSGNPNNSLAVWFERPNTNSSLTSGHVNLNNFNVNITDYGIAVDPFIAGTGSVDGKCNWWGAPNGPGPVGSGAGAKVTLRVVYSPWLILPAPGGPCVGGLASTPGKVTGGGQIPGTEPIFDGGGGGALLSLPALVMSASNPNEKATFGFVARCCPESGNLEYNDHEADVRIKALSITGLFISSPGTLCPPTTPGTQHAVITGTANVYRSTGTQMESLTVEVDDCGEPGSMDTFGITTDTYANGPSVLLGGNIQIHK